MENQVWGAGECKIDGVDVGDRVSRGMAVHLVKMGHTKPLLTPEEKLKDAKRTMECKKMFYKLFMPVKPPHCKNPTQDPPDFKLYDSYDSWSTDLVKWRKFQNCEIPDLWLIDFCLGKYEKNGAAH